jgi:nitroreductase
VPHGLLVRTVHAAVLLIPNPACRARLRAMELSEVVRRRRMVRNYDPDRPVARDALGRIAAAAQRAPSAGFSQGQRLVIVTEHDRRRRIAEICGEPEYVESGFDPWVSRAPALIVPCVSEAIYHARYREPDKLNPDGTEIDWPVPYWWVDVGATVMLILLAAINEGLAAGFLGTHRIADLQAELGLPTDLAPVGVITVGYPLPDRRSGSLKRGWVNPNDFAHWERW